MGPNDRAPGHEEQDTHPEIRRTGADGYARSQQEVDAQYDEERAAVLDDGKWLCPKRATSGRHLGQRGNVLRHRCNTLRIRLAGPQMDDMNLGSCRWSTAFGASMPR